MAYTQSSTCGDSRVGMSFYGNRHAGHPNNITCPNAGSLEVCHVHAPSSPPVGMPAPTTPTSLPCAALGRAAPHTLTIPVTLGNPPVPCASGDAERPGGAVPFQAGSVGRGQGLHPQVSQ